MTQQEWTDATPVLQRLFKQGWHHTRIDGELAVTEEKTEKKSAAGQKGGRASALARKRAKEALVQAQANQPSTDASSTGSTDAVAKSNSTTTTTTLSNSVLSKRTPVASPDAEVELFRRGKQVLGSRAGGQIAKLKTRRHPRCCPTPRGARHRAASSRESCSLRRQGKGCCRHRRVQDSAGPPA